MSTPMRAFRCLNQPFDPSRCDSLQFWVDQEAAALEYAQLAPKRWLVEANIVLTHPLVIDTDAVARDIADRLGVRWAPPDYYSDILDAPGAAERLSALGYDGVIMDDGSGSMDHRTYVTFRADQVAVVMEKPLLSEQLLARQVGPG